MSALTGKPTRQNSSARLRNVGSRIFDKSYAKGVFRPTAGAKTPTEDLDKSLSYAPEHPLMNRAMVAVGSHATENPLYGHVHVCTRSKGRRCCVRRAEGAIVSERVEAEGDVLICCRAARCNS